MGERLGARIEPSPNECAIGAEHEGRRKASAIGDAAGRDDEDIGCMPPYAIDYLGNERQSCARGAMTARLAALRDDDVGPGLERLIQMAKSLDLADEGDAGRLDRRCQGARIAEGQHHQGRVMGERLI
jgi:hypothetical protein